MALVSFHFHSTPFKKISNVLLYLFKYHGKGDTIPYLDAFRIPESKWNIPFPVHCYFKFLKMSLIVIRDPFDDTHNQPWSNSFSFLSFHSPLIKKIIRPFMVGILPLVAWFWSNINYNLHLLIDLSSGSSSTKALQRFSLGTTKDMEIAFILDNVYVRIKR